MKRCTTNRLLLILALGALAGCDTSLSTFYKPASPFPAWTATKPSARFRRSRMHPSQTKHARIHRPIIRGVGSATQMVNAIGNLDTGFQDGTTQLMSMRVCATAF